MKKIGIFGGTFDPVHRGHVIVAQDLREDFGLEKLLLVPVRIAPHKRRKKNSSPDHRLAMLRAAVRGRKGLGVSDMEIKRGGVSYTIDTVRALSGHDTRITFFTGTDCIEYLPKWREIDALVRECRFVLMKRPGFDTGKLDSIKGRLKPATFKAIKENIVEIRQIDISSTDIRRRLRAGREISHLVPPAVAKYIAANRLYKK